MEFEALANFNTKIFAKEYNKSLNTEELANKVDLILAEVNLPWGFTKQLAKFYQLYPNDELVKDKLANLLLTSVFLFYLDDCIEENRVNGIHWLKSFDNKDSVADTPLDTLYENYIKVFLDTLPEFQRMRVIKSFKDFVDCSLVEHDDLESLTKLSLDEYTDFRVKNNLCGFQVFELEFGLNLCFTEEVFNCSQMQTMFSNFSKYVSIVQDLYSFRKEMGSECGKVNYLNVVIKQNNCDLKEAIDKSLEILNQLEARIHRDVVQIVGVHNDLGSNFIRATGNFLNSTIDFYKICGRYN